MSLEYIFTWITHLGFKNTLKFDISGLKKLQRSLKKIDKTEIEWGWINGKAYPKSDINNRGGIPYAIVAIHNEFGAYVKNMKTSKFIYIPSRPYFQQSTNKSVAYAKSEVEEVFRLALTGGDVKGHLQTIANGHVDILKSSIAQNNMKGLHPKTIAIKKRATHWEDTGKLIQNITGRVIYKRSDYQGD